MKILIALLCSLSFIHCDNQEILDISFLKENGYKEITCNSVVKYNIQESRFVEINKKLAESKTYLLARCFDKDSCLININVQKNKIVCQRYIVSREDEYKRDYIKSDFKEFVDHRVLYLSVDDEDAKEFIERVN